MALLPHSLKVAQLSALNILYDPLPVSVIVDGLEYPIKYNAADMIKLAIVGEEVYEDISEDEAYATKILKQLEIFYPQIPKNYTAAAHEMALFYLSATHEAAGTDGEQEYPGRRRQFSYEHDAELIYAAFAEQYGIRGLHNLHWYEFKALFDGLSEGCQLVEVMRIRTMKIDKDMSKREKEYYRKMKRIHALPDRRTEAQRAKEFADPSRHRQIGGGLSRLF